MDIIDEYLAAYRHQKSIEAELAAAKEITEASKIQVISYFVAENFSTVKRGDSSINVSWRSFGKITDFDAAMRWVDESGEPRSEYLEEVFIKGNPKNPKGLYSIVLDAQRESVATGKPLEECLPPGIEYATVPVVTVRTARANGPAKAAPQSALDKYMTNFD